MSLANKNPSWLPMFLLLDRIYHVTVRGVRQTHGNALIAIFMNMFQSIMFVLAFYMMAFFVPYFGGGIRGDFMVYILSGVFLYMTHIKAMGAVAGADGPTSQMMQHAPMNTAVSICAAAMGALYIQILSVAAILFVYHSVVTPVEIHDWFGCFAMMGLAWFTGVSLGIVVMALKPWAPTTMNIVNNIYQRLNMVASGKMFVANLMPSKTLIFFSWNPLFHAIDQMRGFAFLNYTPHNSWLMYPVYFGVGFLVLGMMIEFYTRKRASASWDARH